MSEEVKRIALKDVEGHNDKKSCWLVIHDNVYDVTKFLEEVKVEYLSVKI